jgi:hypothetical protein
MFGRAPRAAFRLNPGETLANTFYDRNDSMLIFWSGYLK